MADVLDGVEIELVCKKCGRVAKKSVRWVKGNVKFTCACGTVIRLDTNQFRQIFAKLDRGLADVHSTAKKFND
ncbi:MAG: hypothetical protein GXX82_16615 [Syntrophorhabdus sp.]|nr:hypothetical protein [Syntrophorhabdus sp.]